MLPDDRGPWVIRNYQRKHCHEALGHGDALVFTEAVADVVFEERVVDEEEGQQRVDVDDDKAHDGGEQQSGHVVLHRPDDHLE